MKHETWIIRTDDPLKLIEVVARGIEEGWISSIYRVEDETRVATDLRPKAVK